MASQRPVSNAIEIDRLATQLAKDPQSKAFLPLAEEYCKVGMWEEAVSVLEDGLKYYPGFITAMVMLGRAYDQLNQPTKARAVLEGAIKLSPENLRAHRTLIKIYAAQGLTREVMASCRVILAMNPKDEEALSVQSSLGVQEPDKATTLSEGTLASEKAQRRRAADAPEADFVKPVTKPSGVTESPIAAPDVETQEEPSRSGGTTGAQPNPADEAKSSRHMATVAQLESWLRLLEERRRDRPPGGVPESVS
jgi:tetratricopeptide (TPR) repeat protein